MRMVRMVLVLASLLGGCSQDRMASGAPLDDCALGELVSLEVSPYELVRGADAMISIVAVVRELSSSTLDVELVLGDDESVRVVTMLDQVEANESGTRYATSLRNPFGVGIRPGSVAVRVIPGASWDCFSDLSGTTSFMLK